MNPFDTPQAARRYLDKHCVNRIIGWVVRIRDGKLHKVACIHTQRPLTYIE